MKRLVIVLLGLTLLYSCGPVPESKATMSAPDGIIPFDNAVHFKYKNHQYIKFVEGSGQYKISGVVHDPDCKYCKR
jgi:hypothetical protein